MILFILLECILVYYIIRCAFFYRFIAPLQDKGDPRVPVKQPEIWYMARDVLFYHPFEWRFKKFLKEKEEDEEEELRPWD